MKRKEILSTLLISAGLLGAVSCTSTPADEYDPNATTDPEVEEEQEEEEDDDDDVVAAPSSGRPNVILILADDMGYENLSCYGSAYSTPNLDALAAMGTRYTKCYAQPSSSPSRTQLMTGKYNHRNYIGWAYMQPEEITFGNLAKNAGYATCAVGKWQMNELNDDMPNTNGFDEHLLWGLNELKDRYSEPRVHENGVLLDTTMDDYGPHMFSDFAIDFMENRDPETPFFLYYSMVLIHSPHCLTPYSDGWDSASNAWDRNVNYDSYKSSNFTLYENNLNLRHPEMMTYCDVMVGRLIDYLTEAGLMENTVILFTGDNGTVNGYEMPMTDGSTRIGGKSDLTDNGLHVPLLAYWKGHTPVGTNDDVIDFSDFYPTLADLMETEVVTYVGEFPNDQIDGVSFYDQLCGYTGTPREWSFTHFEPMLSDSNTYDRVVHNGEYKYHKWFNLYNGNRKTYYYKVDHENHVDTELDPDNLTADEQALFTKFIAVMDSYPETPKLVIPAELSDDAEDL